MVSEGAPALLTWVFFPVYCGYCLSVLTLSVVAVRSIRRRPAFPIPMVPEQFANQRWVVTALAVFVVVATLAREGAFGDEVAVDFSAYRFTDQMQTDASAQGSTQSMGEAGPPSFAGRPASCMLSCSSPGQVCDAIMAEVNCGEAAPSSVAITGTIQVDEPWCYTPWYKDATVSFSTEATFDLRDTAGSRSHTLSLSGTIQQDAFGPMSCREFRRRMGGRIGAAVAAGFNDVLRSN